MGRDRCFNLRLFILFLLLTPQCIQVGGKTDIAGCERSNVRLRQTRRLQEVVSLNDKLVPLFLRPERPRRGLGEVVPAGGRRSPGGHGRTSLQRPATLMETSHYLDKVWAVGFEPTLSWSQTRRITKLSYAQVVSALIFALTSLGQIR
jgi:hypothetical protein